MKRELYINRVYMTRAELGGYNKGLTAGRTGQLETANPYKTHGLDHSSRFYWAWRGGWIDAQALYGQFSKPVKSDEPVVAKPIAKPAVKTTFNDMPSLAVQRQTAILEED